MSSPRSHSAGSSGNRRTRRTILKTVRLAPDELGRVQRQAHAVGMPVSTYLRDLALGRPLRARRRFRDQDGIAALSRIGNNLRQLRAVAEGSGPGEVVGELGETEAVLLEVFDALLDSME